MRRVVIIDSLYVTFMVSLVFITCCILGDSVSEPIQLSIGATSKEIHESQNTTFLYRNFGLIIFFIVGVFSLSLLMLNYLEHGKDTEGDYYRSRNKKHKL